MNKSEKFESPDNYVGEKLAGLIVATTRDKFKNIPKKKMGSLTMAAMLAVAGADGVSKLIPADSSHPPKNLAGEVGSKEGRSDVDEPSAKNTAVVKSEESVWKKMLAAATLKVTLGTRDALAEAATGRSSKFDFGPYRTKDNERVAPDISEQPEYLERTLEVPDLLRPYPSPDGKKFAILRKEPPGRRSENAFLIVPAEYVLGDLDNPDENRMQFDENGCVTLKSLNDVVEPKMKNGISVAGKSANCGYVICEKGEIKKFTWDSVETNTGKYETFHITGLDKDKDTFDLWVYVNRKETGAGPYISPRFLVDRCIYTRWGRQKEKFYPGKYPLSPLEAKLASMIKSQLNAKKRLAKTDIAEDSSTMVER